MHFRLTAFRLLCLLSPYFHIIETTSLLPGFAFRLMWSAFFSNYCCDSTENLFELMAGVRRSLLSKTVSKVSQ